MDIMVYFTLPNLRDYLSLYYFFYIFNVIHKNINKCINEKL